MNVKSGFPNQFKSKRSLTILALILLIGTLAFGGLFFYQRNSPQTKISEPTLAELRIDGLSKNSPITATNSKGENLVLYNGQETELVPGQYQIKAQVDGLGGVDQSVEIKPNQKNQVDLSLNQNTQPSLIASASTLPAPQAVAKISLPDTSQNRSSTNYAAVNVITPNGVNGESVKNKLITLDQTQISSGDEYQRDLKLTTEGGTVDVVSGCNIFTAEFDAKGENIRYLKVCPDNGQNGFYSYNLNDKKESKLLATSDPVNMIRTAIDPNSNMIVFTKETGEFGLIENGQAQVISRNTKFSAPHFSSDGKYLLMVDNVGSTKGKIDNLYQSFGLKVKAVDFSDLLKDKDKANFKDLGLTYYVPRPDDYSFKFWDFRNSDEFRVGDSPKIFSITRGEIGKQDDPGRLPGRVYKGKDDKEYRVNDGVVYDSNNKVVVTGVKQVIEAKGNLYFLINDYLYRLGDTLIQAYPNQLAGIVQNQDELILINNQGEVLKYQF